MQEKNCAKTHFLILILISLILLIFIGIIINFINIDPEEYKIFFLSPIFLMIAILIALFIKILNYHGKIKNPLVISADISEVKKVLISRSDRADAADIVYYYIKCTYQHNNKKYMYKSDALFSNPKDYLKKNNIKQLSVIVDKENYRRYHVDLGKILIEDLSKVKMSKSEKLSTIFVFIFFLIIIIIGILF